MCRSAPRCGAQECRHALSRHPRESLEAGRAAVVPTPGWQVRLEPNAEGVREHPQHGQEGGRDHRVQHAHGPGIAAGAIVQHPRRALDPVARGAGQFQGTPPNAPAPAPKTPARTALGPMMVAASPAAKMCRARICGRGSGAPSVDPPTAAGADLGTQGAMHRVCLDTTTGRRYRSGGARQGPGGRHEQDAHAPEHGRLETIASALTKTLTAGVRGPAPSCAMRSAGRDG